jgi:putative protease
MSQAVADIRTKAPELLAPAGDFEAMRAAVANGADAVYFGLSNFNARHRATNFTLKQLPEVMAYLHGHNVRGYVTFNTLVFSDELPEALRFVRAVAEAGADAVIVQDLGLARLIGRVCPGLRVHGSTQMTLTEPLGIEFVKRLGVKRVILARELSADDIRKITQRTEVPVEVFIHGALCVSYSGQCLTSESLGRRSANRGQCAQACRLRYDLIVDGTSRDLCDKSYLLSPQDLAAYDLVEHLADLGVCSFKIEGRLKSAHYVAATTQTYRAAIDAASHNRPFRITPEQSVDLAQSFSRGFSHGFFDGVNHQQLIHARFPKSRGVRMGTVVDTTPRSVILEISRHNKHHSPSGFVTGTELRPGDGVVFDEGHPEQDEQGGRVATVAKRGPAHREITFERGAVNPSAVAIGATVWKTDDPNVRRRLESSFARDQVTRRVPLSAKISANVGEKLRITVTDDAGHTVHVEWDQLLQAAQKHPLIETTFREQFGRMGDSPFELRDVRGLETPSPAMVPKSVLNDLRRQAVQQLIALRENPTSRAVADPDALEHLRNEISNFKSEMSDSESCRSSVILSASEGAGAQECLAAAEPSLHVLVRSLDQLRSVLDWRPVDGVSKSGVYCEFEDIRRYKEAVSEARAANVPIGLATVRIIKPGEEGLLKQIADCSPDYVLIRNLAGLSYFTTRHPNLPLVADYSLNVANEITASILAEHGVVRIVPSYDLNWTELAAMLKRFPASAFEAVVHQHMPMFHMEHCVFCHTLSTGTSYRDCGRPCDTHRVELKDRAGAAHPLVADVGCRNTVYNAAAQSAAEFIPRMKDLGLRHFRVEFLRETPDQVPTLLNNYARVLSGQDDGRATWRQLRVLNQLGITRGTLNE